MPSHMRVQGFAGERGIPLKQRDFVQAVASDPGVSKMGGTRDVADGRRDSRMDDPGWAKV